MAREVVVTGANGWIGGHVGEALAERGWSVTGVSRTPEQARERRPAWRWIGPGPELEEAVTRAGMVVNLAGRHPFEQLWTDEFVAAMRSSRIDTTRRIADALASSAAPDRLLVSGSGYPVYGDRGERVLRDDEAPGRDLVAGAMDADWEQAAIPAAACGARLVLLRLGLTLGADGGAFPMLRRPFEEGSGVVLGCGRQWVPWIHIEDAVRLVVAIVEEPHWSGPVNLVAPEPARHERLAAALSEALGVPCETTVPAEGVEGLLGGASELLLSSIRMVPARALELGFRFTHPEVFGAVKDLVAGT